MLASPKLRVLALTTLLFACAPAPPRAPGNEELELGEGPPPPGYVELGRVEGTHGEGCGVFGARGSAAGAMQRLRNAALARGADYLRVTKTTEPTADRNCVSHVYKAEGVAYRKASNTASSQKERAGATWELLYSSSPEVKLPDSRARLTPPEQAKLLHALFDRYIEDGACAPLSDASAPPSLEQARAAGQFRPVVGDAIAGAFTAPGASELLVLVHVGECYASAEQRHGTRRFVVLRGETPVLNVETGVTDLEGAKDLDLDGTLEVLTVADATKQGLVEKQAMLFSFAGGKATQLEHFGPVFEDTCATQTPSGVKSTVIRVLPGAKPEFRLDESRSACESPAPSP